MRRGALLFAAAGLALAGCQQPALAGESTVAAPQAKRAASEKGLRTAVFAGGCFWGVEAVFSHVKGVTSAVSGYAGGDKADADYDVVSSGRTRHAEAVKVTYDPSVIRYDQLLRIYFSVIADPTLKNRQGPDTGPQYRTALFPRSAEQAAVAKAYIAQLGAAGLWSRPIVTTIESGTFYPAESYHQDFADKNPAHPYIRRWDAPKVAALKAMYPGVWKSSFTPG
ncbi:peptide-methionine (S)-S-oxide reductase MsrA [Tsuneonella sp. YG55]|uniref:Peptide methionine sulfoxide reductase MsrA n=1 Tax=Tsuneonella litorea TaxID=2976475 RepID=A0A9X2W3F3_9SPHN|nr:peptide-methionine (S)-S-oxide reductase MsrA [Tsuneonella litorea]MCT2559918.1 peptide-methionine (S)-S-oxide reductase MsrA [Tsuneonella litorea]